MTASLPRTRTGRPRLTCTDSVLDYWVERIGLIAPKREHFDYSSMICEGDSLYHYGHHFELGRIMRDKRGRARLVLLNGDTYEGSGGFGPSTSSRQADVRRAVARTDTPSIVVPFSALDGAGIDYSTIRPIHVRGDRHTTEEHSSRRQPAKMGAPNRTVPFGVRHGWCTDGAQRGEDGVWRWRVRRHWLGDSIFRARSIETRTRKATAEELAEVERHNAWDAEFRRLQAESRRLSWLLWRQTGPRDYRRMLRQAWAEAAIRAAIERHYASRPSTMLPRVRGNGRVPITVTRWATFLSSFDYQESRPLYFLCELPHGAKPNTVEEAIEALKPPEVIAAQARGLNVIRQGDLFAIPTKLTKRQIRRMARGRDFEKRLRVLGTNHSVTEGIVLKGGAVLGRGTMRHEPEGWRPPDHAPQKLGDTWHLLVRNTVPRSR